MFEPNDAVTLINEPPEDSVATTHTALTYGKVYTVTAFLPKGALWAPAGKTLVGDAIFLAGLPEYISVFGAVFVGYPADAFRKIEPKSDFIKELMKMALTPRQPIGFPDPKRTDPSPSAPIRKPEHTSAFQINSAKGAT